MSTYCMHIVPPLSTRDVVSVLAMHFGYDNCLVANRAVIIAAPK